MGKVYSEDLRLCVLAAIDGGMSKMTAHKTFGISRTTMDDWFALRAATGSLKTNTSYRRGKAPTINDLEAFTKFVRRYSGCTLQWLHPGPDGRGVATGNGTEVDLDALFHCAAAHRLDA